LRGSEVAPPRAGDLDVQGKAADVQRAIIDAIAFVVLGLLQVGGALGAEEAVEEQGQELAGRV
jgi:hypothetical protein